MEAGFIFDTEYTENCQMVLLQGSNHLAALQTN